MTKPTLTEEEFTLLRQLLDRKQIIDGIYRYARGVDRADLAVFKSVFWSDGRFDGGPVPGCVWDAADEMINEAVVHLFSRSQHLIGNILINFDASGTVADVESYAVAYHQTHPTRKSIEGLIGSQRLAEMGDADNIAYDLVIGLRYIDKWEKRGDTWRIFVRKLAIDWSTVQPSSTLRSGGIIDNLEWCGARGAVDPVYDSYS